MARLLKQDQSEKKAAVAKIAFGAAGNGPRRRSDRSESLDGPGGDSGPVRWIVCGNRYLDKAHFNVFQ